MSNNYFVQVTFKKTLYSGNISSNFFKSHRIINRCVNTHFFSKYHVVSNRQVMSKCQTNPVIINKICTNMYNIYYLDLMV